MNEPIKIICIDDEPAILRALKRELSALKVDCQFVSDSVEAYERVAHEEFTLVLTDYLMPRVKGDLILERVAKLYPKTRRLLLSGSSSQRSAGKEGSLNLFHAYLRKPWDKKRLLEVIQQQLVLYGQEADPG